MPLLFRQKNFLVRAHIVALTDFYAVMTQNRVCGGDMEEKLRQPVVQQVRLAGESFLFWRARTRNDFALLVAVDLFRREAFNESQGFAEKRLQVRERLFVVLVFGHIYAGKACRYAPGKIGGNLHLADQGEHVREQASLKQDIGIDILCSGMLFSLGQNCADAVQHLLKDWNGSGEKKKGHAI